MRYFRTTFFQTIGALVGIGICSLLFNNTLISNIERNIDIYNVILPVNVTSASLAKSPESIFTLLSDPIQQTPVINGYVDTLRLVFLVGVSFSGLMFVTSLLIQKIKLKD